jgi:hypothetical protein
VLPQGGARFLHVLPVQKWIEPAAPADQSLPFPQTIKQLKQSPVEKKEKAPFDSPKGPCHHHGRRGQKNQLQDVPRSDPLDRIGALVLLA